jgi:[acyl-carrier-protein] S-malonyltransferase
MPVEELEPYLIQAQEFGALEIANLNSPSQNVIAGEGRAVEAAIRLIEDGEPAVQAIVIEPRIPMHTPMFRPVASELRPHLEAAAWRSPAKPYVPNVLGGIAPRADASCFTELLERHVYSPVQWRRSIEAVAASHHDARFVEVGPGAVLFNLLHKRWLTNRKFKTDDPSGTPPLASDELLGVAHGC